MKKKISNKTDFIISYSSLKILNIKETIAVDLNRSRGETKRNFLPVI